MPIGYGWSTAKVLVAAVSCPIESVKEPVGQMPVIKIPKQDLIEQDEAAMTVDVPATVLALRPQKEGAI
jgi:hypothetical protein